MWRKLRTLSKFEWQMTWADKSILFFTLIAPTIYFVVAALNTNGHPLGTGNALIQLTGYWAYIVLVGVLNGFEFGLINLRETNFLKMFTVIAGDRRLIFYSNLAIQTLFIQVEMVCFDVVVIALDPTAVQYLPDMAAALLLNFLLVPIIAGFTNFFLLMPIKGNAISLIVMGYIMVGMLLINVSLPNEWALNILLTSLNPCSYVVLFYAAFLNLAHATTSFNGTLLVVVGLFYLMVGYYPVRHMRLQSLTSRY
ncbi:hypothetical protein [Levilactobacillus yonginensis]|uniref:hypothetical protein n=1 Tax=Levilactobacillus yonginensis TaxID=1054041 RepID=UPI000F766A88|nr:hypothetical protein [Levilactobacillus yonginensis]